MDEETEILQALTQRGNLTVKEFAELTHKSYTTIRGLVADTNQIKADVVGKGGRNSPKYSIPTTELDKYLNAPKLMGRPRKSDPSY